MRYCDKNCVCDVPIDDKNAEDMTKLATVSCNTRNCVVHEDPKNRKGWMYGIHSSPYIFLDMWGRFGGKRGEGRVREGEREKLGNMLGEVGGGEESGKDEVGKLFEEKHKNWEGEKNMKTEKNRKMGCGRGGIKGMWMRMMVVALLMTCTCICAISTSGVRNAVDTAVEGDVVLWERGDTLDQTWSGESGWEITKAITLRCSDVVEKCEIDAKASESDGRRVLLDTHGNEESSFYDGLIFRGGYTVSIVRWGAVLQISNIILILTLPISPHLYHHHTYCTVAILMIANITITTVW